MDRVQELILQEVTEQEVVKIIRDMSSSHSYGHDGIDSDSLKISSEEIAGPIKHIINLSIVHKKFPSKWKLCSVIPLHKGGKKSQLIPESFCPISLLPCV